MKRLSVLFVLISFSLAIYADVFDHPADIADPGFVSFCSRFSGSSMVSDYTQIRRVERLGLELESNGRVYILEGEGMAWIAEEPYESIMIVGRDSIRQRIGSDETTVLDVSGNQIYLSIADAVENVFIGDFDSIDSVFDVYFQEHANMWQIGLIPKNQAVASFLSYIIINGSEELFSDVSVMQSDGNSVRYIFSNIERRGLSDEEREVYSI